MPAHTRLANSAHLNASADAAGFAFAGTPDAEEGYVRNRWLALWPVVVFVPSLFAAGAIWVVASYV